MNFKISRTIMTVGFVVGILIMATGISFEPYTAWFMATGIIIYAGAFIQALIFYRCPHCNYCLLNIRGSITDFCPNCGGKLKNNT